LYAGGADGVVSQLVIKEDHALITDSHSVGSPITSLNFNPSHHKLAVGCSLVGACTLLSTLYLPQQSPVAT